MWSCNRQISSLWSMLQKAASTPLGSERHYPPQLVTQQLRWPSGKRAGLWYPSSQVQTRPKLSDFSGQKILSAPSFGGEVKPLVPCHNLRHVKEPRSEVEVTTFGKILGNLSPIVPPSTVGVHSRRFRRGDTW